MIFEDNDRIVFAGDSVTDMGSTNPVGEGLENALGNGYVRIIENLLTVCYPQRNIRVTNSGVSGNNSRDLLQRFDSHVVELHPDWVAICIGINDVWRQFDMPAIKEMHISPEEYRSNLCRMVEKINGKVKGIFILSPYYIESNKEDMMRRRMDEYTEICRDIAEQYNCIFVDFQKMFAEFCRIKHSSFIAYDRVHPSQIGSTMMAREFLKHCDFDFGV